jgi:hypothetical protein
MASLPNDKSNTRNRDSNVDDSWISVDISSTEKKTLSRSLTQPHGTIEYMVIDLNYCFIAL